MKTFSITSTILCFVALVAFASCSKEELPITPENTLPEVITVSVEENTKMTIEDYRPVWREGDEICVDGVKYRCTDPNTGTFIKAETKENDGNGDCCYPYSLYQGPETFSMPYIYHKHHDIDFMPMFGKWDSEQKKVSFKNLGSVCRFRIKNTSEQTIYTKSMIITPTFNDATTMHINGEFTVHFNNDIPQIHWSNGSSSSHLPFVVINFPSVITLAPNGYHDVYAFLPKYIYNDLNIRTEGYLTQECNQQVYFSSVNKGRATVERNNWYDIPVKADSWSAGVRGNGTPEIPFQLGSPWDISYINSQIKARDVNAKNYFAQANYVLTQDITITENWTEAIACSVEKDGAKAFNGVFDGQGHTFKIASGHKATRPLFYDVKGGVIKNLIIDGAFEHSHDGDAAGTVTFSPFFYSAQNAYMVACAFKGNVYKCSDGNVNPDLTKPAIFGAMNNTCHLIACTYTQDGITVYQGVQLNGDSSTISDVQNVEIYNTKYYNQVIGRLNGALGTWNNNGSTPDIAKTPYIFTYPSAKPSEFYLVNPNN